MGLGVGSPSPRNIGHPISRSPKRNKHKIWEETKEKLNVSQDPPGIAGTSPANINSGQLSVSVHKLKSLILHLRFSAARIRAKMRGLFVPDLTPGMSFGARKSLTRSGIRQLLLVQSPRFPLFHFVLFLLIVNCPCLRNEIRQTSIFL
jgi:hypothetical protein